MIAGSSDQIMTQTARDHEWGQITACIVIQRDTVLKSARYCRGQERAPGPPPETGTDVCALLTQEFRALDKGSGGVCPPTGVLSLLGI